MDSLSPYGSCTMNTPQYDYYRPGMPPYSFGYGYGTPPFISNAIVPLYNVPFQNECTLCNECACNECTYKKKHQKRKCECKYEHKWVLKRESKYEYKWVLKKCETKRNNVLRYQPDMAFWSATTLHI